MAASHVLAFDFGLKHIGVAVGQTVTRTASGLATLKARAGKPQWQEVLALVNDWRPSAVLVGLPLNMDGTESEMSDRARQFAAALGARCNLPVHMVDERLTSRASRDAAHPHEMAAVLIAETWLAEL